MSTTSSTGNVVWFILYPFAAAIDAIQIVLTLTGVGALISEILEVTTGPIIIGTCMAFGIPIFTKPRRIASLLGLAAGDALTGGLAPFWILDVFYIHYDVRREEKLEGGELSQQALSNNARNPLYKDGKRTPRTANSAVSLNPVNINGVRTAGIMNPVLLSNKSVGNNLTGKYSDKQLKSLQKERPENSSSKRFTLSKEEFSKERLGGIRKEVDTIKKSHPEVLSLAIFGSMVKGTAHKNSDIDGHLYVDTEMLARKNNIDENELLDMTGTPRLRKDIEEQYATNLQTSLKKNLGLTDEFVEDIRPEPISEKIIDNGIERLANDKEITDQYMSDWNKWRSDKPSEGASQEEVTAYQNRKPKSLGTVLPYMFHLDVGGGIGKYRKLLLTKLSQRPDGDEVWKKIIRSTKFMEGNENKYYPQTLDDAITTYGGSNLIGK